MLRVFVKKLSENVKNRKLNFTASKKQWFWNKFEIEESYNCKGGPKNVGETVDI